MQTDIEKYCDNLIKAVIANIEAKGGKKHLSSIILTGSFGRNEPTFDVVGHTLNLRSDVEIALVVNNSPKKVDEIIKAVASEFSEDLNLMRIDEKRVRKGYNFNYSLFIPRYKTIFTYDLFNGSKTVWGVDFLKTQKIGINDIDIYEAKRLVGNRIGELVYLQTQANQNLTAVKKQWKGKLVLAIVSAWLICEKLYVSSYHGQRDIAFENKSTLNSELGEGFFEEYEKVFSYLRKNGEPAEVDDALLREYVSRIDMKFRNQHILKPKVNCASRTIKYLLKYFKSGFGYGIYGFENNILQALISDYSSNSNKINETAEIWHKVLY